MSLKKIFPVLLALIFAFSTVSTVFADSDCTIVEVVKNNGEIQYKQVCGNANGVVNSGTVVAEGEKTEIKEVQSDLNAGTITVEEIPTGLLPETTNTSLPADTTNNPSDLPTNPTLPNVPDNWTYVQNPDGTYTAYNKAGKAVFTYDPTGTSDTVKTSLAQFNKVKQYLRSGEIHGPFEISVNNGRLQVEHINKNDDTHFYIEFNMAWVAQQLSDDEFDELMKALENGEINPEKLADMLEEPTVNNQVESQTCAPISVNNPNTTYVEFLAMWTEWDGNGGIGWADFHSTNTFVLRNEDWVSQSYQAANAPMWANGGNWSQDSVWNERLTGIAMWARGAEVEGTIAKGGWWNTSHRLWELYKADQLKFANELSCSTSN